MKFRGILLIIFATVLMVGCGGEPQFEGGFQPIGIPIRVSINQDLEINLSTSYAIPTPIGVFDLSAGYSIRTIRNDADYPVLIIRLDDEAIVYPLEEGKRFEVSFSGNDQYFKEVALIHDPSGDIILELESVNITGSSGLGISQSAPSNNSLSSGSGSNNGGCPGAFTTRLEIGARARVVAEPRVVVRERPGEGSDPVYGHSLSNGRTVTILDGPVCQGGMLWWKGESGVITLTNGENHNIIGWMAEESGDEWLLEPLR